MKMIAATALLLATTAASHAGFNGTVDYSWDLSASTAALGETVSITLWAEFTPGDSSFYALASADFDILLNDISGGGIISNNAVHPSFAALGDPGTIAGDDILAITAEQFPAVDSASTLALYTFDYTIDDATLRMIDFTVENESNLVFTTASFFDPIVPFIASMTVGKLEVTGVPAPGAMALLGIAGVVGGRRRRRGE